MSGDTNVRTAPCRVALDDHEAGVARHRDVLVHHAGDPGRARGIGDETGRELVDDRAGALDLDEDAGGVVADVPGQTELGGQAVHVGPEPHALDEAGHTEAEAFGRRRRGDAGHAGDPLRRPRVTAASRCIRPKL